MRRPRLFIVNPNTNASVTRWLAEEAERIAGADFEIEAVSAPSGLAAIETSEHLARAAGAVVATIEAASEATAAIIGAFGDPGLAEARAHVAIPVVGLGEAGLHAAGAGGRRFSIVTLGEAMRAPIVARVEALRLGRALVDIHVLPFSIAMMVAQRDFYRRAIIEAVHACEGEAVLLGGAPFAGLAAAIAVETERVVLDGVQASISRAFETQGAPRV